ncbi:MAG: pyridoxamine 5'-phosphate oxidase family protein [Actinomycetota bacterium]|nr:pyridoxamine 5'-phosphate oxidase family protein [Actinomycetota bacterium]
MATDETGLEILLPHECLQLLAARVPKVGRVGVIHDDRPDVLPVNYAIFDGAVVFRTGRGAKLTAAMEEAPVAFEVDAIDASWEEGWSVVVHGHAELLDSEDVISKLGDLLVRPWVPAERASHIRIVPERITGRSIEAGRHRRTDVPSWDLRAMPPRD